MNRSFVTGDTHRYLCRDKLSRGQFLEGHRLTKASSMLITGDFGAALYGGLEDDEHILWYGTKRFSIKFVDGNHDNPRYLYTLPEHDWGGGRVHYLYPTRIPEESKKLFAPPMHLMRGYVYEICGKTFFVFGGGDTPKRYRTIDWQPEEMPTTAQYDLGIENLEKHNWEVDYVITHAAPSRMLSNVLVNVRGQFYREFFETSLNKYLDMVFDKLYFKKWFCGHYHREVSVESSTGLFDFYCVYNRIYEITDSGLVKWNRW
ncbi:MAG: hypothetical protein GY861_21100 [bacterium]|nr:hypothetical protein [bacterium]